MKKSQKNCGCMCYACLSGYCGNGCGCSGTATIAFDPAREPDYAVTQIIKHHKNGKRELVAEHRWQPNAPITHTNHPPCEHCDLNLERAPCTCLFWD